MITKERIEELEELFWSETNEPWTTEWREDLSAEEDELIYEWDEQVSRGFRNLLLEIHRLQEIRRNREA